MEKKYLSNRSLNPFFITSAIFVLGIKGVVRLSS
jgi:hypothetical protein